MKIFGESSLNDRIAIGKYRLRKKLLNTDLEKLDISEYNQRYLKEIIRSIDFVLEVYGRILEDALRDQFRRLEDFTLVDYGGGSGVLSLLAKEMNIGCVIYDDIYEVSCFDVKSISKALGLGLDHVVCGDVVDLLSYVTLKHLSVDAVVSFDVLEHIYDIDDHLKRLSILPGKGLRIIYASTANSKNPWTVRALAKKQISAEHTDKRETWGTKGRDSRRAYYDIRKKIISTNARELSKGDIAKLAGLTRGLKNTDILDRVKDFQVNQIMPSPPGHATNTCDPITGNWCEHLIGQRWLKQIAIKHGYSVKILPGYYSSSGSLTRRAAKKLLNIMIRIFQKHAMFISPYFVLFAERDQIH